MNTHIVVEDAFAAALLERVLPSAGAPDIRIVVGGAQMTALSMGCSLRVDRFPVIVLLDARSVDEASIREQQREDEFFLCDVGPPLPAALVLAVPAAEVVLFHDVSALERLLAAPISERSRIEARFIPAQVLAERLRASGRFGSDVELVRALDAATAKRLSAHPLIQTLERHVAEFRAVLAPPATELRRTG
ncbi:MAG TPA: hypothetical protein VHG91_19075 [Longimicrobium sp.]|nr:hypothetical protein [Longimicrobium sp.]